MKERPDFFYFRLGDKVDAAFIEAILLGTAFGGVAQGEDGEGAESGRHGENLLYGAHPILQRGDPQPDAT